MSRRPQTSVQINRTGSVPGCDDLMIFVSKRKIGFILRFLAHFFVRNASALSVAVLLSLAAPSFAQTLDNPPPHTADALDRCLKLDRRGEKEASNACIGAIVGFCIDETPLDQSMAPCRRIQTERYRVVIRDSANGMPAEVREAIAYVVRRKRSSVLACSGGALDGDSYEFCNNMAFMEAAFSVRNGMLNALDGWDDN